MNLIVRSSFCLVCVLVARLCLADSPASAPATAPAYNAEQKASLDALDGVISRFEAMLSRDDDLKHKANTQAALDGFKQRQAAIHQNFDQGRYDELRIDLNLEYQRLASWMKPPNLAPPKKPPATNPSNAAN